MTAPVVPVPTLSAEQELSAGLGRSVAVPAGAGSGKTRVLCERYVRALIQAGGDVERVLAVTFTEKAAGELRTRVRDSLELRGRSDLAGRLSEAWIGTIHSACRRLLAATGPERGRPAGRRLLDEAAASEGAREGVDAALDRLADGGGTAEGRAALRTLLALGGVASVREGLLALWSRRARSAEFAAVVAGRTFGDARARVEAAARDAVARIAALPRAGRRGAAFAAAVRTAVEFAPKKAKASRAADALRAFARLVAAGPTEATAAAAEIVRTRAETAKPPASFADSGAAPAFVLAQTLLTEAVPFPFGVAAAVLGGGAPTREDRAAYAAASAAAALFGVVSEEIRARLAAANATDFDGLLEDADALLDDAEAGGAARGRFSHVLVDEFQDTDPTQWRILSRLLQGGAESSVGLCLVGDEKQAIYGFRGGDVRTFRAARAAVVATPGGALAPLADNYRSCAGLVAFVNRVQETIFADDDGDPDAARPEPMRAARPSAPGLASTVEIAEVARPPAGSGEDAAARAEARELAARVAATIERGAPVYDASASDGTRVRPARFRDVAVLLRARTHLAVVEDALAERGVPYRTLGGAGLYARPETGVVLALFRHCVDPDDDAATIALARSPLGALSDSVLLAASVDRRGRRRAGALTTRLASLAAEVAVDPAILPTPEDAPALVAAVGRFARWRELSRAFPPDELPTLAAREADWPAFSSAAGDDGRVEANLVLLAARIRAFRDAGAATLSEIVLRLGRAVDRVEREAQADPPDEGVDAVSILTEHAAKGLEWPIVALCFAGANLARSGGAGHDAPIPTTDGGLLYAWRGREADYGGDEGDAGEGDAGVPAERAWYDAEARRRRTGEEARLFYVALTRARDRLLIVGAARSPNGRVRTRLGWLSEAFPDDVARVGPAGDEATVRREEASPRRGSPRGRPAPEVAWPAEFPPTVAAPPGPPLELTLPASAASTLFSCRRRALLDRIAPPPFAVLADAARAAAEDPRMRGRVLHAALEAFALRADPEAAALSAAAAAGATAAGDVAALAAAARAAVAGFGATALGRAVRAAPADRVAAELPVVFGVGPVRLGGAADLVLFGDEETTVVDYKSAGPKDADEGRALVRERGYDVQLGVYAAALARTGAPKVRAVVHFFGSGLNVDVPPPFGDGERAAEALDRVLAACAGPVEPAFPLTDDAARCATCPHLAAGRCPGA